MDELREGQGNGKKLLERNLGMVEREKDVDIRGEWWGEGIEKEERENRRDTGDKCNRGKGRDRKISREVDRQTNEGRKSIERGVEQQKKRTDAMNECGGCRRGGVEGGEGSQVWK